MSIFCPKIYTIYTTHILLITKIQKYLNANCPNSLILKNIKTLDFFNSNFSDVFISKNIKIQKFFKNSKKNYTKLSQFWVIINWRKFIVQFEILTFDKNVLMLLFISGSKMVLFPFYHLLKHSHPTSLLYAMLQTLRLFLFVLCMFCAV